MRKYFSLLMFVIVVAAISCKKDAYKPADTPPPTGTPVNENKVVVTTIAGSGINTGFLDGPALSAKFAYPEDVVVAADGTMYVTDLFNGRIRKIAGGQVSTFAGNTNTGGIANGHGISALFIYPSRIAQNASGNLYTLDGIDARVREISPSADVSTYAGIETPGFKDGRADIASFKGASSGIVADAQGNIYVSDTYNHSIRKISVSGDVITIAGNGFAGFNETNGTDAQFNRPGGIALDEHGNIYVADEGNYRIRKITTNGQVSTIAGNGSHGIIDGRVDLAQFAAVGDMVIDKVGNLYVTDSHRIRKISTEGIVSTIAGSGPGYADGDGTSAKFYFPTGLGIDAQDNMYVADAFNQRIRKISFK